MKNLPVLLNVRSQSCLIVGGGKIATRRAKKISPAGIVIDLISDQFSKELEEIIFKSGGKIEQRKWLPEDVQQQYAFVIAATDDHTVNTLVAEHATTLRVPVNVVSDDKLSTISFPTIIDRDPLIIAVSSGTASPVLAKTLSDRIDALIPSGYGRLATLVSKFRKQVNEAIIESQQKQAFWKKILTGNVAESIFSGNPNIAESLFLKALKSEKSNEQNANIGEVYLIGAGPGDPDLLTFRAYRLLQQSDVVFYDRLVSPRILEQINTNAEKIYVGKKRADHSMQQQDINANLITQALAGKRVARLKGGDPFIFGRGGEEIEQLAENKIPFQIVPGITAASGCATYSGIPLTHRDHAQSVCFVTGQLKDGTVDLPWQQLVAENQTVVIYMGLIGLPIIAEKLMENGMEPNMPVAMIEQGTTLDQKIHCSTISHIADVVAKAEAQAPTLLIIGTVVSLHDSLKWFET